MRNAKKAESENRLTNWQKNITLIRKLKRILEIDSRKGKDAGRPVKSVMNVAVDNIKQGVAVIVAAGTQARAQYAFKGNGETIHEETTINVVTNNTIEDQGRGMEDQDHMKKDIISKRNIDVRKEVTNNQQDRDRDLREIRTRQGTQAKIKEGILRDQQDTNKTTPLRPSKENE